MTKLIPVLLCFIFFAFDLAGQGLSFPSEILTTRKNIAWPSSTGSSNQLSMSIGEGDLYFSHSHWGFSAMSVIMINNTSSHSFKKNTIGLIGIDLKVVRVKHFSLKLLYSQGIDYQQDIKLRGAYTKSTFDGLMPVLSTGIGVEYKMNKKLDAFIRYRWLGSYTFPREKSETGAGIFLVHYGFSLTL